MPNFERIGAVKFKNLTLEDIKFILLSDVLSTKDALNLLSSRPNSPICLDILKKSIPHFLTRDKSTLALQEKCPFYSLFRTSTGDLKILLTKDCGEERRMDYHVLNLHISQQEVLKDKIDFSFDCTDFGLENVNELGEGLAFFNENRNAMIDLMGEQSEEINAFIKNVLGGKQC